MLYQYVQVALRTCLYRKDPVTYLSSGVPDWVTKSFTVCLPITCQCMSLPYVNSVGKQPEATSISPTRHVLMAYEIPTAC